MRDNNKQNLFFSFVLSAFLGILAAIWVGWADVSRDVSRLKESDINKKESILELSNKMDNLTNETTKLNVIVDLNYRATQKLDIISEKVTRLESLFTQINKRAEASYRREKELLAKKED